MRGAIVTGGSSGIGLAVARILCEGGHAVTVTGRRPEKLEAAVAGLEGLGGCVQGVAGDISDPGTIIEIVGRHEAFSGRVDVLFNNAGVGIGRPVEAIRDSEVELEFGVNLRAVILMYRAALPQLRVAAAESGNVIVINNASLGGKRPVAIASSYSAMKAGVVAFTASMNRELGAQGIKSTALCPAYVDTEMTSWLRDDLPAEEMLTAADVAGAVRWLLSTSRRVVVPEIELTRPGDVL
jgi:3-oxoacyl-[acyl-carrier protein] reductase